MERFVSTCPGSGESVKGAGDGEMGRWGDGETGRRDGEADWLCGAAWAGWPPRACSRPQSKVPFGMVGEHLGQLGPRYARPAFHQASCKTRAGPD
jgi:hypothetical protein